MFKVLKKKELAPEIKLIEVEAPLIAKKFEAGQFVVLRTDDKGERIPLTIYDADSAKGTLSMVFLEVGTSTKKLGRLEEGDSISNLLGPLGNPFPIRKFGTVACVGGGVGVPAVYPIAKELKKAGNKVISIIGARTKELLILEEEMKAVSDELFVATDDGSYGQKGFVTDVLKEHLGSVDLVLAVGPLPMMNAVCNLTRDKVKTMVSLNPIMVDGTGMCGGCRVMVGGKTKFACVDGPDFDGHDVDFKELMNRNSLYLEEEADSLKRCGGSRKCLK